MICRRPVSARNASDSSCALFAVMPLMRFSRSGSRSRMSSVSTPKRSTIRRAVAGPMPLMMPEDR